MLAVAGANTAGTEARSPSWEMLCSFLLDDDDDDVMLCSFVNDDDDQMLCSFLLDHDHESYQMLWSLC